MPPVESGEKGGGGTIKRRRESLVLHKSFNSLVSDIPAGDWKISNLFYSAASLFQPLSPLGWEMSLLRALARFVHDEIYPDPFSIGEDYDEVEMVEGHKTKRWEVGRFLLSDLDIYVIGMFLLFELIAFPVRSKKNFCGLTFIIYTVL